MNGVSNVKSDVLVQIWDRFHAHKIEFPFPQHDVHIRERDEPTLKHTDG